MKLPPLPRIEVFKGKSLHYVRLKAKNGETMNLTEGYSTSSNATRAAKRLKAIVAAATIVVLGGCAQLGPTEGQIKAMEGTSSSFCVHAPGWNGSPIDAHYSSFGGKSTGTAGGGGKAQCGNSTVEFTNEGKLAPAPKVGP